jgi:hypothetical protein
MEGSTSRIARMKNLLKVPVIFGLMAGALVILFNLAIEAALGSSMQGGYLDFASNNKLVYLIPFAVAVQMGLFRHYRNITINKTVFMTEMVGVSGSAFSTVTLVACCVACCVAPVWNILPAIGMVVAASSFAMQYQDTIILIAMLVNVTGSAVLLMAIRRHRRPELVKII